MSQRTPVFLRVGGILCVLGAIFSLVTVASWAADAQVDRETARPPRVKSSIPPRNDLSPAATLGELPDAQEDAAAVAAAVSAKLALLSDLGLAAAGVCDSQCDYCHCGTVFENNCPLDWRFDLVCDCGCQFCDPDCPSCFGQDCPGSLCGPACDFCWIGTPFEDNCPLSWCGASDGCDCGCQFADADCLGGSCPCDPVCGNGICEASCGELCANCPGDCACGACCEGDVCTFKERSDCLGLYMGNGTVCEAGLCAIGSCCPADGICRNAIASQCVADGESFRPDVTCLTACPTCSLTESTVGIFADAAGMPADAFDRPGHCAIDARQPHSISNAALTDGWDRLVLFFSCDPATVGLEMADMLVSATPGGVVPRIQSISIDSGANTATVHLDRPIAPGQWTCITHDFFAISWCAGYLPADASQDGLSAASDINALIDSINFVAGRVLPVYAADIDRSGMIQGTDILRLIDLLNGADAFTPWIARTLPACPQP